MDECVRTSSRELLSVFCLGLNVAQLLVLADKTGNGNFLENAMRWQVVSLYAELLRTSLGQLVYHFSR